MSDDRGLPRDAATRPYDGDEDPELGDHSHGHVTLAELHAYDWWQTTVKEGVIGLSVFARWNRITPPPMYSGGVSGPNIVHLTTAEADAHLKQHGAPAQTKHPHEFEQFYVTDCTWLETAAQCAGNFLTFVAEMTSAARRLDIGNTDIRLVFGFDS
jgi:hypothetical protein